MAFESVIAQDRIKKIFTLALKNKRLAHAYLLHGLPGVGKDAMAIRLAMGLNCEKQNIQGCGKCLPCRQIQKLEHPSVKIILPAPTRPKSMKIEKYNEMVREKTLERIGNPYQEVSFAPAITAIPSIGIDQIRTLKHEIILKQQRGQYRVFILSHADRMTIPAANSLLKLLEEPPPETILILTTSAPDRILSTIASRCQKIRFDALSDTDIEQAFIHQWKFERDNARFFSRLACGSAQRALALANGHFEELRTTAWDYLNFSIQGNQLKRMDECDGLIRRLDKTGVQSMLQLLLTWLRDLICLKAGVTEKMINIDREETLNQFLQQFDDMDLELAISYTEHAIASLRKNVYLSLIVHTLSQKLNRLARIRFKHG
ncbi:DNA polymerase III subunit delta' [bacterium]|nr:DNA polymerase III subunit delta' [bacterium]